MYQGLKWTFIGMLSGILFILFLLAGIQVYNRPHYNGSQYLPGLQGAVSVTRDQWGVPHIVAQQSDLDAFFALGYVHAQDRFWQMELQRHIVQGRLSEWFGKRALHKDEYLRTWGFYRAAQQAWPALSPQTQAIVQAYTNGVNAYIRQRHFPLSIHLFENQPQPWTVIDSIAWQKMLAWDLQTHWQQQLRNYQIAQQQGASQIPVFFPDYPPGAPTILNHADLIHSHLLNTEVIAARPDTWIDVPAIAAILHADQQLRQFLHMPATPGKGSNNWVVSGQWTSSGKPLLANDPHLSLQAPALWYLAELRAPHLHVIGATIPGMPGVVIGHNDHIAWGVTNVNPDSQDLYVLPPHTALQVIHEQIYVRNQRTPIDFPVRMSALGPVLMDFTSGKNRYPVALHWTALQAGDTTVQSVLKINYAQNWPTFVAALQDFVVPSQNFVYADTQGNIGYYLSGKIPRRSWSSILPVPDDTQHQWQGFIPFTQLPHVFNPPAGVIVTANNRAVPTDYPYILASHWSAPPYRAERILTLLQQLRPLDVADNTLIQNDTISLFWRVLAPMLLRTSPRDAESRLALQQLAKWNGAATLQSVPMTIFAYWYRQWVSLLPPSLAAQQSWPDALFLQQQFLHNGYYCAQAGGENCQAFLSASLQKAMRQLTHDLGNNPKRWQWQRVHQAEFKEMGLGDLPLIGYFWRRHIPAPGAMYTVNVGSFLPGDFRQTEGASYRQVVDLQDWDRSLYIQTLGQSGAPWSRHYSDQLRLWRDGRYLPMSSNPQNWGKTQVLWLLPEG